MHVDTIAIISQKGGAGKTTLAIHLAAVAAQSRVETIILDADPQATATTWAQWRESAGLTEPEVIDCASPPLLARKLAGAAELGARLAIIDTPPHADIMAREACKAANLILIPCRPQAFDLAAVATTAELVRASGKPAYVIWIGGPQRAPTTYKEAGELIAELGLPLAPVMLTQRAVYHHSTGAGKTAIEIEPAGKAADEITALWAWTRTQVDVHARIHKARAQTGRGSL